MINKLFALIVVLVVFALPTLAQDKAQVYGQLNDATEKLAMVGANVQLISVRDTTQHFITVVDGNGVFKFANITPTFYKLTFSSVGYKTSKKFVRVTSNTTNLGVFEMIEDKTVLDAIEIKGKALTVETKGDTTSINAEAFKVNPDATAEDLIAKMPSIIVNGSGVQAQGEQVGKVLVDGREFFANDPSLALKTIPASIVQKIEIFDQQSDQAQFSGFEDGNTTKTLNIVTKPENRNGQFGRVYAGANADSQYKAGGNVNHFDNALRLSVVGLSNNINKQNFTSEDLLGIASAGSRRGGRGGGQGGGGGSENFQTGSQEGISETHAYGLNYSDEWGKKVRITGSYFFNYLDNANDQLVNRENFVPNDENQFYSEANNSTRTNINQRFNMRLIYSINERNSLIFIPTFSWQKTTLDDKLFGNTTLENGTSLNSLLNGYASSNSGYNGSGSLMFRHRFDKRGRTFSIRTRIQANENIGKANLDNLTVYQDDILDSDTINQLTDLDSDGRTYSANINYSEPLGERMQLQIGYSISLNETASDKLTYDASVTPEAMMPLDTALSNVFRSQYVTNAPSLGLMYRKEKMFLRASIAYQSAYLNNSQEFPLEGQTNRSFSSFLPSAMMHYRFSKDANLRMFYRSYTQNPTISQLQNVVDNSNPIYLTTGNPELNQSTNHMLTARYSSVNTEKSSSFFMLASARLIDDYITNTTYVASNDSIINDDITLRKGGQISAPINLDGYVNARLLFTYGLPVSFLKSNVNLNLGTSYTRTPGLVNRINNISNTLTYTGGVVVASNISENIDYTLGYDLNLNTVNNNVESSLSNQYVSQNVQMKLNWIFLGGFVFRNQFNYQVYTGYSDGFNDEYMIWNMSVARKFLKKKQFEVELGVFDLLNQNTAISRINTESYIEEVRTDVLQQYFMLTCTYTFQHFKGFVNREKEKRGPGRGRW